MATTLKNLALALLNATLILIALCLFLAWKLADKVDGITATFAQNLEILRPLREEVGATRTELVALRADLAQLGDQGADLSSEALQRISARVDQIDTRMDTMRQSLAQLSEAPELLIDHAIETAADEFATGLSKARGCTPAPD